jgi:hypothetical protein
VFDVCGISDLVDAAVDGYNVTGGSNVLPVSTCCQETDAATALGPTSSDTGAVARSRSSAAKPL